jgi:hypothetical protein
MKDGNCGCTGNYEPQPSSGASVDACNWLCHNPTKVPFDAANVIQQDSLGGYFCICSASGNKDASDGGWTGRYCNESVQDELSSDQIDFYFGNTSELFNKTQSRRGSIEDGWVEANSHRKLLSDATTVDINKAALYKFRSDVACYFTTGSFPAVSGDCEISATDRWFSPERLQPVDEQHGQRMRINGTWAIKVSFLVASVADDANQADTSSVIMAVKNGSDWRECEADACFHQWDLLAPPPVDDSSSDGLPWWLIIIIVLLCLCCCCCIGFFLWKRYQKEEPVQENEELLIREQGVVKRPEESSVPDYMNSPKGRAPDRSTLGSNMSSGDDAIRTSNQSRPSNGVALSSNE